MILVISIAIGILAALLTQSYLAAKDREISKEILRIRNANKMVKCVVLTKTLPAGSPLQQSDLGLMEVPSAGLRSDYVKAEGALSLIGRRIINTVERNKPLYWIDIEGGQPVGGLSREIKNGMRAISINASGAAAVSGMIRPNDHVDLLGTFNFPNEKGEPELVTFTILQDVTILAVGKERARSASQGGGGSGYGTVTLEVTPREAEMLVFSEQIKGRLFLVLRHPNDTNFERELPKVDFSRIQGQIEKLNLFRQQELLRKRVNK